MKTFLFSALLALTVSTTAFAQPHFVGSFAVGDGPSWMMNPQTYSGRQAAALLFGGDADDYLLSTNAGQDPSTINNKAWYDGWAEPLTQFDQNFFLQTGTGYNDPGGFGTAWSAYVHDHSGPGEFINYVWSNDAADVIRDGDRDIDDVPAGNNDDNPPVVPEPAGLALLIPGALGLLRRRIG